MIWISEALACRTGPAMELTQARRLDPLRVGRVHLPATWTPGSGSAVAVAAGHQPPVPPGTRGLGSPSCSTEHPPTCQIHTEVYSSSYTPTDLPTSPALKQTCQLTPSLSQNSITSSVEYLPLVSVENELEDAQRIAEEIMNPDDDDHENENAEPWEPKLKRKKPLGGRIGIYLLILNIYL